MNIWDKMKGAAAEMGKVDPTDEDSEYLPNQQLAGQGARNLFNAWMQLQPDPLSIKTPSGQEMNWMPPVSLSWRNVYSPKKAPIPSIDGAENMRVAWNHAPKSWSDPSLYSGKATTMDGLVRSMQRAQNKHGGFFPREMRVQQWIDKDTPDEIRNILKQVDEAHRIPYEEIPGTKTSQWKQPNEEEQTQIELLLRDLAKQLVEKQKK